MVSYFMSRLYFHEPKASEMTRHIPRLTSVINDLFYKGVDEWGLGGLKPPQIFCPIMQ